MISIHAPLAGSDYHHIPQTSKDTAYFYPRSPRGERQSEVSKSGKVSGISIHAPLAGSDIFRHYNLPRGKNFYPRSPRGERPIRDHIFKTCLHFYPRSPRGERHYSKSLLPSVRRFLSTLPSRGATAKTNKPLTYFCMEMTKLSVPLLYKR